MKYFSSITFLGQSERGVDDFETTGFMKNFAAENSLAIAVQAAFSFVYKTKSSPLWNILHLLRNPYWAPPRQLLLVEQQRDDKRDNFAPKYDG